jgi:hypothetical protein
MVPVRSAPALAATLKATWPPPVPEAPAVIVSQVLSLDAALHEHEPPVVTVSVPVPPAAVIVWLPGLSEYEQGAACCVTVKTCPPIVSVPVRDAPVFAATE